MSEIGKVYQSVLWKGSWRNGKRIVRDPLKVLIVGRDTKCKLKCHGCDGTHPKGIVISVNTAWPLFAISDTWCINNPEVFEEVYEDKSAGEEI